MVWRLRLVYHPIDSFSHPEFAKPERIGNLSLQVITNQFLSRSDEEKRRNLCANIN